MALEVLEVVVHAHLVAVVVDAEIEAATLGIEHAGYAAEDVELLCLGVLAHAFAGRGGGVDYRGLELEVFRLRAVVFAASGLVVDVEFLLYLLQDVVGDGAGAVVGFGAAEHVVAQYQACERAFEVARRAGGGGIQLAVAVGVAEPRHHFEAVVNHAQKRVGRRYFRHGPEGVGVDTAVYGIVLVHREQRGVSRKPFGQLVVGNQHGQEAPVAQIVVSFYEVGLGYGSETQDADNLADVAGRECLVDVRAYVGAFLGRVVALVDAVHQGGECLYLVELVGRVIGAPRNIGAQLALLAGLRHAAGDDVAYIVTLGGVFFEVETYAGAADGTVVALVDAGDDYHVFVVEIEVAVDEVVYLVA